jgi:hypothetical protein
MRVTISFYELMQPEVVDYTKRVVVGMLADPISLVRQTSGSVITTLVQKDVRRFADLLKTLLDLLDNADEKVSIPGDCLD